MMNRTFRMKGHGRRHLSVVAALMIGSVGLAACGQGEASGGAEGGGDGEQTTISFAWWGSDSRHEKFGEIIDDFNAENPDVKVVGDYADWGGYWDKLATQTAGGDIPDVMMMDGQYLAEYVSRGVLTDLYQYDIPLENIDETLISGAEIDGGLWGVATGSNVLSFAANPRLFEEAGVELPDDTTWTWEDYDDLVEEITANTESGVHGGMDFMDDGNGAFSVYARQHGQELFTTEGELGYDDELLVEWWERALAHEKSGAHVPLAESTGLATEQLPIATNTAALGTGWSSQLPIYQQTSGDDLVLLRFPGEAQFDRPGMWMKAGMYMSVAESSEHPEVAARFIDYFVNSESVGKIMLAELGMPANSEVREAISGLLPEADQTVADFNAEVSEEVADPPPPMPPGAGEVLSILTRINEEVLFEQISPEEAAAQFREDAESVLG